MTDLPTAAPGGGDGISLPIAPVTPASEGTLTAREAAQALSKARWAKRDEQPTPSSAPEAAPAEPELASPEADAAPPSPEAPGEVETQAPDPADTPPIEPPRSWTKDEQERFKTYPRELQAYLSEREQERDRDLRRRQNEAAEARKAVEAEQAATVKARQEYEAKIPLLMESIQQQMAGEFADVKTWADVQRMAVEDPIRYNRWDAQQKQVAALASEAQAANERQAQEHSSNWAKFAQEQDKLFAEKVPDLADPAKASKLRDSAVTHLRDLGFTEEELTGAWNGQRGVSLRDHRIQLLILDGVKYRDAKAAAAKPPPKPVPPVQRPGVAQPRGAAADAEIQALTAKLEQSGSIKDAVALTAAKRAAARQGR